MNQIAPAPLPPEREQRLKLANVNWDDYVAIGNALRDRPAFRLTYDRGTLEIMTTSPLHEFYKKRLSRLVEALAEGFGLPLESAGSMTFQRHDLERGLEPDDCYWIEHEAAMRGRLDWNPECDPPPDLVLEIEVSRSAQIRMEIYAKLQVSEVWRFDGATLEAHVLQADGSYQCVERSLAFLALVVAELMRFLLPEEIKDSLSAVREFREWVRGLTPPA